MNRLENIIKSDIQNVSEEMLKLLENEIEFKVKCSKGTYIRSLCADIAKRLGTIGYMKDLKRLQVGEFNIKDSIKIDDKTTKEDIEKNIITIEKLFEDKKKINLDNKKLILFLNGVKLSNKNEDGIYRIYNLDKFIGIGIIKSGLLKRDIVI